MLDTDLTPLEKDLEIFLSGYAFSVCFEDASAATRVILGAESIVTIRIFSGPIQIPTTTKGKMFCYDNHFEPVQPAELWKDFNLVSERIWQILEKHFPIKSGIPIRIRFGSNDLEYTYITAATMELLNVGD